MKCLPAHSVSAGYNAGKERLSAQLTECHDGTQVRVSQDVSQLAAGQYSFGVQLSGGAAGADSETVFTIGEQVFDSGLSGASCTGQ